MTKKEALDFLELSDSASDIEIKIRIADKLSYFEELSENAPSDFLRRLHGKNVAKIKTIQEESVEWISPESRSQVILPLEPGTDANPVEDEDLSATTIIISSGSKASKAKSTNPEPVGWLVRHTEGQSGKTFPLFIGKNFIGRKVQPELSPYILIEDDAYVSRVHAVLYVKQGNPNEFYIVDSKSSNNGSPSKNGTYVNGNETRIETKVRLEENDTIQIGVTKLILKLNNGDINKIVEEVQSKGYMNTVIFDAGE
jgi:pSer/pThr/pTyr-binding forkhead associated (FHA) protein